jgi:hypothetical protein
MHANPTKNVFKPHLTHCSDEMSYINGGHCSSETQVTAFLNLPINSSSPSSDRSPVDLPPH